MNPNANLTINAAKLRQWAEKHSLSYTSAANVYADYLEDIEDEVGETIKWVVVDQNETLYGFVTGRSGTAYLILDPEDFEDYTKLPANWDPEDAAITPNVLA